VDTKEMKGHKLRVMSAIKRHSTEPNFREKTFCYAVLVEYMLYILGDQDWFIVDSVFCSVKNHFHLVGCDNLSCEAEELRLLNATPKVEMPILA